MADKTIVNYDDLFQFEKRFQQEGEEYAALLSKTRQMVHDLEKDWVGLGAEKFFNEFEGEMLPGLQRLQEGLLFAAETLANVRKIFDEAENESGQQFEEGRLEGEGAASGVDVSNLDFGMGDVQVGQPGGGAPAGETPPTGSESASESGAQESAPQEMPSPLESEAAPGGGGSGGSSGGSEGLQGDLEMGEGSSSESARQVGVSGESASEQMPDRVYQSSSPRGAETPSQSSTPSTAEGEGEGQSGRGAAGAAGALGGASAAAGAAAKFINKDDEDDE